MAYGISKESKDNILMWVEAIAHECKKEYADGGYLAEKAGKILAEVQA